MVANVGCGTVHPGHLHGPVHQHAICLCPLPRAALHQLNMATFPVPSSKNYLGPRLSILIFLMHSLTDLIPRPFYQAEQHPWEMSALVNVPWEMLHSVLTSPTSTMRHRALSPLHQWTQAGVFSSFWFCEHILSLQEPKACSPCCY